MVYQLEVKRLQVPSEGILDGFERRLGVSAVVAKQHAQGPFGLALCTVPANQFLGELGSDASSKGNSHAIQ